MALTAPKHDLQGTLDRLEKLPVFPDVALRVHQVARRPGTALVDMEKAVSMDPTLAARILKMANSPFYGRSRRVRTVGHAVQILGFHATRDLAIALSVGAMSQSVSPLGRAAWHHAVTVGVTTRNLTKVVRGADRSQAFITGLLHDVGSMLLLALETEAYEPLYERFADHEGKLAKAEAFHLGYDHSALGAAALRRWELPEALCHVVEHHHHPPTDASPGSRLLALVMLADVLAPHLGKRPPESLAVAASHHPANESVRIPGKQLLAVIESLPLEISELEGLL